MNLNCNSINKLNDGQSCYVIPESNMCFNRYNLYINGMLTEDAKAINNLNKITVNDANNVLIYNKSDYRENQSFFGRVTTYIRDVFNAILGKFSSSQGVKVEKSVQSTVDFLKDALSSSANVTINAHSQGAIILNNALYILKDTLSNEEWNNLTKNVTINVLGSPVKGFPKDLNVTEWKNSKDFVTYFQAFDGISRDKDTRTAESLESLENGNGYTCETPINNYKIVDLDAEGHSFDTYVDAINYYKYVNE